MASNQSVSVDTHELNQQLEAWRTRHTELRTKNNELTMLNNELTINNNELRNKNELMKNNIELRRQLRNEQKARALSGSHSSSSAAANNQHMSDTMFLTEPNNRYN